MKKSISGFGSAYLAILLTDFSMAVHRNSVTYKHRFENSSGSCVRLHIVIVDNVDNFCKRSMGYDSYNFLCKNLTKISTIHCVEIYTIKLWIMWIIIF